MRRERFKKTLRDVFGRRWFKILSFVALFALLGTVALMLTRASGVSVAVETESGNVAGNATKVTGTPAAGSSGNAYVKFGTTSGPGPSGISIPDTSYAIPASAVYVSPTGDNTHPGTLSQPVATFARALAIVPTGGTIVFRAGVYHEGEITITKDVTVQPYPHEQAWLDGTAQVTGWTSSGSSWYIDNSPSQYLCNPASGTCVSNPNRVDPSYPMSSSPQMVFVNGTALTEVSRLDQINATSFYYDAAAKRMHIGVDPTSKTVEIAVKRRAFIVNASGVTIRGIGIRRYGSVENTAASYFAGAMTNSGGVNNILFENNAFTENASRGLYISPSSGVVVRGNLFISNGMNGFHALSPNDLLFEKNTVQLNNTERYSFTPGASNNIAGALFICATTYVSKGTIQDNIFNQNTGNGLWASQGCNGMTIVRNVAKNNQLNGMHYEAGSDAIIASNLVYGNKGNGIQVIGPRNRVYNNTLSKNRQNLAIWQYVWALGGSAYYSTDNIVKNNIFSNTDGSATNLLTLPAALAEINGDAGQSVKLTPSQVVTAMNNNAYYLSTGSTPANILAWRGLGISRLFTTLDSTLKTVTGSESLGIGLSGGSNPFFVSEAAENYQLDSRSVAVNAGEDLPADIASAIGIPSTSVNIGAISWPGASPAP